jgi:hypothetical protein
VYHGKRILSEINIWFLIMYHRGQTQWEDTFKVLSTKNSESSKTIP